nr:MAG TPA_asm: hypothetical protein [Caudoviricetes sp.]
MQRNHPLSLFKLIIIKVHFPTQHLPHRSSNLPSRARTDIFCCLITFNL